ncbi:uncharacterized protein LOC122802295 [Protopterus annectens]|uniref:uncharacterized protein LOC122802295 n=1 Tax=Protopterus annectens TaxID=7888 RepID=UPI001CFAC165|nr:uncharacterized protein LOC122802295 [Protopterus annectens]
MDLSSLISGLVADREDLRAFGLNSNKDGNADLLENCNPDITSQYLIDDLNRSLRVLRANVWHSKLFKAYQTANITPRGLRIRIAPHVGDADDELTTKWTKIQHEATMSFVVELYKFHNRAIDKGLSEIMILADKLKNFEQEPSFEGKLNRVAQDLKNMMRNYSAQDEKFNRDQEDYSRESIFFSIQTYSGVNCEKDKFTYHASNFSPPMNAVVHQFQNSVLKDVHFHSSSLAWKYNNITFSEKEALLELQNNKQIVITSADKGGAVVIQNWDDYNREALRQLSDTRYYNHMLHDPIHRFSKCIGLFLKNALDRGIISKDTAYQLTMKDCNSQYIYFLPKVHKNFTHPPGRPIVSGRRYLTEPLSLFLTKYLKPLLGCLRSRLNDTTSFLQIISDAQLEEDWYLCTLDVCALYTNIPHQAGRALAYWLEYSGLYDASFNEFLVDMARYVLTCNVFYYKDNCYWQIKNGYGASFAPIYADLFMAYVETKLIYDSTRNIFLPELDIWRRYLDDIWLVWRGTESSLLAFVEYLNNNEWGLGFTEQHDAHKMIFLDVVICKLPDGTLESETYRKFPQYNSLLHATSFHAPHIANNIPKSQFIRAKRICSQHSTYRKNSEDLIHRFKQRGYKTGVVINAMSQVQGMERNNLLQYKDRGKANTTPEPLRFTTTYGRNTMGLVNIIRRHWNILQSDSEVARIIPDKCMFSYRNELNPELNICGSENSVNSNASLPSVQSCRRHGERRIASWAVSFERLLQDPLGIQYFSEFLKKEFSEENILFWQACELFSHVSEHDKKQLSQMAKEIYSNFLSSKAITPVNIDSQAQLADDVLNAPHPDMFKAQQLQIFNLMKFDSYTRFLKSRLYQECMLAEVEGRPLPDPLQIPSSPASKHSVSSDRSNISTPKKFNTTSKSGKSLSEDSGEDDSERKKRGTFFSWSRNKSVRRSLRKKESGESLSDVSHNNGISRRESQGSMSSGTSSEVVLPNPVGNQTECENVKVHTSAVEKDKCTKQCQVYVPDGASYTLPVQAGTSVREMLFGLCCKLGINIAAVDLFLAGGDKPLVLDQDSITLSSRDLRLEKRTLFRLDLVPINRSVGLKAKPTKPVTEVLRPVVAKYGLNLNQLVVRVSGEIEPLDLGIPISNLDGLRIVLDMKDCPKGKGKQKGLPVRQTSVEVPCARTNQAAETKISENSSSIKRRDDTKVAKDGRILKKDLPVDKRERKKSYKTDKDEADVSFDKTGRKKSIKIDLDEAEEFFEMLSKAQSNRAEDQRGLLRKEDLVLPDFLCLKPDTSTPSSSTPAGSKCDKKTDLANDGKNSTNHNSLNSKQQTATSDTIANSKNMKSRSLGRQENTDQAVVKSSNNQKYIVKEGHVVPFNAPLSPIPHIQDTDRSTVRKQSDDWHNQAVQTIDDDEYVADLTLVAEGDITSPNSTLLPPPPSLTCGSKLTEANFSSSNLLTSSQEHSAFYKSTSGIWL